MKVKTFRDVLENLIQESGRFVTDTINIDAERMDSRKFGMDDCIYVAGENKDDVFMVYIQKIEE